MPLRAQLRLPRSRPLGRLLAVVGVALVAIGLTALPASAHHPLISATADCNGKVSFTSTAWANSNPQARANADIRIQAQIGGTWTQVGSGAYTPQDYYSFRGTFTEPTSAFPLQLRAYAAAKWGDGADGGSFSETTVSEPSGCQSSPPTASPKASLSHTCSTYTVVVTNPGDHQTTYTVTQGGTTAHTGTVGGHSSSTWTSGTLTQGSYHVVVTSPAATKDVLDTTVDVPGCQTPPSPPTTSPPTTIPPTATVAHTCSTYTVVVTNPGDHQTTYTVTQGGTTAHTGTVGGHSSSTWTSGTLTQGSYHVVVTSPAATKDVLDTTVDVPGCQTPPPSTGTPTADIAVSCHGYDITVSNTGGTTSLPFEVTVNGDTSTVSAAATPQHVTGAVASPTNVFSVSQAGTVLLTKTFNASSCTVVSPPAGIPTVAPSALIRANCTGFITVLDNSASTVPTTFVVTTNAGRSNAVEHPVTVAAGTTSTPAKWPVVRGVAQTVTVTAPQMQRVSRTFARTDCVKVSAPTTQTSGTTGATSGTTSSSSTTTSTTSGTTGATSTATSSVSAPSASLPKTGNQVSAVLLWVGGLLLVVGGTLMRGRRRRA